MLARNAWQHGYTPLATAAYNGKVDCIRALVELGADVNAKNNVRALLCWPVPSVHLLCLH